MADVDYENLWKNFQKRERVPVPSGTTHGQLESERCLVELMLTRAERQALAKLSPETKYVMGV